VVLRGKETQLPARIAKVALDGKIRLDGVAVSADELEARLADVATAGEEVVLYREAPFSDPDPCVGEVIGTIIGSGVLIVTPDASPSEWGELERFSLRIAPERLELTVERGGDFRFTIQAEPGAEPRSFQVPLPADERIRSQLDLIISCDRVLESKENRPELAFLEHELITDSLHVEIVYAGREPWRCCYSPGFEPANLRSLASDCQELGLAILGL